MTPLHGLPDALILLDCETTGGKPGRDRITEVAFIQIENGMETCRWQTLLNPEVPISPWIAEFTGITNAMVANAPTFAEIAPELLTRLQDRVLVAHNARFDYGFLKAEFKRAGLNYTAKTLCTVQLSRALYPQYDRHGLDEVVRRLGLGTTERHRAMADTEILLALLQQISRDFSAAEIDAASKGLLRRVALPPHLDLSQIDHLPTSPGVYYFYDSAGLLLYVGKSVNLRERVLSHFGAEHRQATDLKISQSIARIEVETTPSDFGAQLRENQQIKALAPAYNRRQKKVRTLCQFELVTHPDGYQRVQLVEADVYQPPSRQQRYGLFRNRKQAETRLLKLVKDYQLCPRLCGLEAPANGPCFASQLQQCRGACCGKETPLRYNLRLAEALQPLKLQLWPWPTAVVVCEYPREPEHESTRFHAIDQWVYLGRVDSPDDIDGLFSHQRRDPEPFDIDTYRILVKFLLNPPLQRKNRLQIQPWGQTSEGGCG